MPTFFISKRAYFILLLALTIGVGAAQLALNWQIEKNVYAENNSLLANQAQLRSDILKRELSSSEHHVRFLAATPPIQGIVRATKNNGVDPYDGTSRAQWLERLQVIFKAYLLANPAIAQIRYIGAANDGLELIRVQREAANIVIVPAAELQEKGSRPYIRETLALGEQQVYVSDINLNREFGEIEQPPWPTYRVATAIYESERQPFGIIIINFNAKALLDSLNSNLEKSTSLILSDQAGRYLIHPDPKLPFKFEYGDISRWQPSSNENSTPTSNHIFIDAKTKQHFLFAMNKIPSGSGTQQRFFHLVTTKDIADINSTIFNRQLSAASIAIISYIVCFLLLTLSWLLSNKTLIEQRLKGDLQALIQGSGDAIITTDRDGTITDWNPHAEKLFGQDKTYALGKPLLTTIFEDSYQPTAMQYFKSVLTEHTKPQFEINARRINDNAPFISVTLSPILLGNDNLAGVAAIVRDISDQQRLHKAMLNLNKQLTSKNRELEQFIYTISHDLKAPLVTIKGFSLRLEEEEKDNVSEKSRHRLNRIISNVDQMNKLLEELLRLSRIARSDIQYAKCDLQSSVNKVLRSIESDINMSAAKIQLTNGTCSVHSNETLLQQCLQNLISNAIHYRADDRQPIINISYQLTQGYTCIQVQDNGKGIDKQNHETIFKLFEKLEHSGGSGVGLAIVKTIMDKHQGKVTLSSKLDEGSVFTLYFPEATTKKLGSINANETD